MTAQHYIYSENDFTHGPVTFLMAESGHFVCYHTFGNYAIQVPIEEGKNYLEHLSTVDEDTIFRKIELSYPKKISMGVKKSIYFHWHKCKQQLKKHLQSCIIIKYKVDEKATSLERFKGTVELPNGGIFLGAAPTVRQLVDHFKQEFSNQPKQFLLQKYE